MRGKKKKRLFIRYLVSYLLILIIPMLVGSYAYTQTVKLLREEALGLSMTVLEQSEENLNQLLQEVRDVSLQVSMDADLFELMPATAEAWSADTIYNFYLQKKELSKLSTNPSFSRLFLYHRPSQTISSREMVKRASEHPLTIGQQPFGQWLDEQIAGGAANRYLRLEQLYDGPLIMGNYLAYLHASPGIYGGESAIVILISEQEIMRTLRLLVEQSGSFAYVADSSQTILVSASDQGGSVPELDLPKEEKRAHYFQEIEGQRMLITYLRSAESGWTYVAGVPANLVFAQSNYIKIVNWAVLLSTLGLSCLIALYFARRHSKPLLDLLESIKEMANGDTSKRASEVDMLKSAVHQVIRHSKHLDTRMKKQMPLLQEACLDRLLKPYFHHEGTWRTAMEEAQVRLFEANMTVAVVKIFDTEYLTEGDVEEQRERKQEVARHLQLISGPGCYVHALGRETLGLIVSFESDVNGTRLEQLVEQLREIQENVLAASGIMTAVGIGQVYHSVDDLWRSYNEANQALESSGAPVPQQLLCFAQLDHDAGHYYYPLDLEQQLGHLIRSGEAEGLERLFTHLEEENFQQRSLTPLLTRQLLQELQGTLQKLGAQIKRVNGAQAELWSQIEQLDPAKADYTAYKSFCLALCMQMRDQQRNKLKDMLETMITCLHEQYADSNLSLGMLAREFKQTESFLSVSFKEHTGVTFSEYVENLRLQAACRLLRETDSTIQEIALETGYNSDKSFRRAFKRVYGILPTMYRKRAEETMDVKVGG